MISNLHLPLQQASSHVRSTAVIQFIPPGSCDTTGRIQRVTPFGQRLKFKRQRARRESERAVQDRTARQTDHHVVETAVVAQAYGHNDRAVGSSSTWVNIQAVLECRHQENHSLKSPRLVCSDQPGRFLRAEGNVG
ncbi:hypothetical protein AAFF_G00163910 [Aldrovandia affinis]|uniref:Uncharacterized protein n=1 Tax=Aldrovandia affinis TaxID=143900 RepID=A0AAD7WWI6_9TELE|nr:hypothetical protein AAFF_G00163910 [Aldrovandia affinis]